MDTNGAGDAFVGGEITELICRQNGVFLWDGIGRYLQYYLLQILE